MPAPTAPKGMGIPKGEVPEELAQVMGGSKGSAKTGSGGGQPKQNPKLGTQSKVGNNQTKPRAVGSLKEEAMRAVKDVWLGLKEFFSLNTWLGIDPEQLDPKQKAKAKQIHSRYQRLDKEQQMVTRQMFEQEMQKKKLAEQEEERKKQIEKQKNAQTVVMPSSPKKGPVGFAGKSRKQKAKLRLDQSRNTIGTIQGE